MDKCNLNTIDNQIERLAYQIWEQRVTRRRLVLGGKNFFTSIAGFIEFAESIATAFFLNQNGLLKVSDLPKLSSEIQPIVESW